MPMFVIQEHHARTHHFDFRLEKDGVFKSWAVPKGLPEQAGIKHLAIEVGDHALTFGNFEGTIPMGQYGAGDVRIVDRGTYESKAWTASEIAFELHGQTMQGAFCLIRFKRGGPRDWLLFRRSSSLKETEHDMNQTKLKTP